MTSFPAATPRPARTPPTGAAGPRGPPPGAGAPGPRPGGGPRGAPSPPPLRASGPPYAGGGRGRGRPEASAAQSSAAPPRGARGPPGSRLRARRPPPQAPPSRPLTSAKGPHGLRDDAAPGRRSNWRAAPALPLYRRGPARRAAPFPEASRTFRKNPPQPPPRPRACACALATAPPLPRARAGPPRALHPQRPPRASPRPSPCACAARNSRESLAPSGTTAPSPASRRRPCPLYPGRAPRARRARAQWRHPGSGPGIRSRCLSEVCRSNLPFLDGVPRPCRLRDPRRQPPGAPGQF